ncbi:MAG: hypothetical protein ACI9MC_003111 [Kiritimatiellia bacterium]|jgi:hypothetical protein
MDASTQHTVDEVLRVRSDGGPSVVWRRTCQELTSGPRVAVAALTAGAATRVVRRLAKSHAEVSWVAVGLDLGDNDSPGLGVLDALYGVHAVIWATSAGQPMGARERRALQAIDDASGPSVRAVVLVDTLVLDRISDDPDAELSDVRDRITALVSTEWTVLVESEGDPSVPSWVHGVQSGVSSLARGRMVRVAQSLLRDARLDLEHQVGNQASELSRYEALRAREDEALDRARAVGKRAAAHTLAAMKRRTEELLNDLRTFLTELERSVDSQINAVGDPAAARRVLPHWIEHVVQGWLRDRLAQWRLQVLGDLRHVRVAEEALAQVSLLTPALHPAPFPSEGRWNRALGLSAGVGGGLALAAFGLWVPALVALGGGVAWSVVTRDNKSTSQAKLVERARGALRKLGTEAESVLADQLQRFEDQLATLGDDRASRLAAERRDERAAVEARVLRHHALLEDARTALEGFDVRVSDLSLEPSFV